MEIIQEFGLIAGIAGLGVGVFLFLFKSLISNMVLSKMSQKNAFNVIMIFMILVWSLAIFSIYVYWSSGAMTPMEKEVEVAAPLPDTSAAAEIEEEKEEEERVISEYSYVLRIKTSDIEYSDTDDHVYIRLIGTKDVTSWFELKNHGASDFKIGSTDIFDFSSTKQIGDLTKLNMKIVKAKTNTMDHLNDLLIEKIMLKEIVSNKTTIFKTIDLKLGDSWGEKTEWTNQEINISWE